MQLTNLSTAQSEMWNVSIRKRCTVSTTSACRTVGVHIRAILHVSPHVLHQSHPRDPAHRLVVHAGDLADGDIRAQVAVAGRHDASDGSVGTPFHVEVMIDPWISLERHPVALRLNPVREYPRGSDRHEVIRAPMQEEHRCMVSRRVAVLRTGHSVKHHMSSELRTGGPQNRQPCALQRRFLRSRTPRDQPMIPIRLESMRLSAASSFSASKASARCACSRPLPP